MKFPILPFLSFWLLLLLSSTGCSSLSKLGNLKKNNSSLHYTNPVLDTVLADPSVIWDPKSQHFYAYGTEDNWNDGQGNRLIPIMSSKNLVNWTLVGNAFDTKPSWKSKGGLWAPDINYIDGKYYLYYSFSVWNDPNPGIGLAISESPVGPFNDQGKLFTSKEVDVPNSIDPFYFEDEGKRYLFWGSYSDQSTQGTFGVELSKDGQSVPDLTKKFKVAAGDFEAVVIHKKDGYYYFFGSRGSCCDGSDSQYHVLVGRSTSLQGPYFDRQGYDIRERNHGTLLYQRNDLYVGPGHQSDLITDDNGTDWILYHAIKKTHGKLENGTTRRVLMLDPLHWKDGWPTLEGATPSTESKQGPVFY